MARVRAELVQAILQFVAGAGGNAARVRAAVGLKAGDLLHPERMLPLDQLAATLAHAADDLGDPAFGLHVGSNFDLEGLGLVTYAVLNAPTVETGINNLVRCLGTLVEGIQAGLEVRRGEAVLSLGVTGLSPSTSRHLYEGGTLSIVRMLRRLVGEPSWKPSGIAFRHPAPAGRIPYVHNLGVAPRFGARAVTLRFPADVLSREVPNADRSLLPVVEHRLRDVMEKIPGEEPWLAELRVAIASRLCDGHPSLPQLAPVLGFSVRTLQRRLSDRGLVYRDIVQEARRRLALEYLEGGDTDLTEVAFLLGYAELSAFTHAFRRWTGSSPGAHRRSRR